MIFWNHDKDQAACTRIAACVQACMVPHMLFGAEAPPVCVRACMRACMRACLISRAGTRSVLVLTCHMRSTSTASYNDAYARQDAALADVAGLREALATSEAKRQAAEKQAKAATDAEALEHKQLEKEIEHEHEMEQSVKEGACKPKTRAWCAWCIAL